MSFTFGQPQPNSSGQSSGGLFGTAGAKNDGQNLFGGGAGAGWSFGQAANAGSSSGTAENKSGGGLFGSSTPLFGKPAESKGNESKPPSGGIGSPFSQTPGTPSQPTSSAPAIGTTTPAASGAGLFGMKTSTTPAGLPPANSFFGASTGATANQSQPTSKPTFSFGNTATASSGSSTPVTKASGMFGPQSSQPSSSGGSLFGQGASGGLFGAKPSTSASTPSGQTSSVFGTVGSSSAALGAKPADSTSQPASSGPTFSFGVPKKDDKPAESAVSKPFSFPTTSGTAAPASSQPAAASQPVTTSLFGQASTTATPAGSTPSFFGNANPASSGAGLFAKPSAPASQSGEQQKSSFFSTPAASTATSQPALPAASKPLPGFSLGGAAAAASQPASAALTTAPATAATSAAAPSNLFSSLGGAASAASSSSAAPPSTITTATTTAPAATPAAAAPSTSNLFSQTQALNASTSGPPAPAQSRLRNKTMEEILTRWASDLSRYTKEFKQHAETIAKWDQIIVDNATKIDKLYVKTRTCEKQTMSVEMQLAAVENQQNELETWLNKYENDVDEMLAKDGPVPHELGGPDQERERTYKLAERLGERLDDMSSDLKSMIEEVNASNELLGGSNKADEPITQIVKILNSHLSQLQAIDQGTSALQAKVAAAQKTAQGMNYMNGNGGLSGDNAAAVDGFYRSYMGRR